MWEDDARRMKALGIEQVRIAEFAWSRIEPSPGEYDWGWLDRAIDVLGAAGLQVVMCTPTATPPEKTTGCATMASASLMGLKRMSSMSFRLPEGSVPYTRRAHGASRAGRTSFRAQYCSPNTTSHENARSCGRGPTRASLVRHNPRSRNRAAASGPRDAALVRRA